MDRLFLDANVLFSAAYREHARLARFWDLEDVELSTSEYAREEAQRNLGDPDARTRLSRLLANVEVVAEARNTRLPDGHDLPEMDRPILAAAIAAGATHLITGDVTHFGSLYGRDTGGLTVKRPAVYLRERTDDA